MKSKVKECLDFTHKAERRFIDVYLCLVLSLPSNSIFQWALRSQEKDRLLYYCSLIKVKALLSRKVRAIALLPHSSKMKVCIVNSLGNTSLTDEVPPET